MADAHRVIAVVVASALGGAGCGVLFVDSPRSVGLRCTSSKISPYGDYAIATGLAVGLVAYGGASEAPASLSVPAAFLLSGLWGSHKVNQCRERLARATPEEWQQLEAADRARAARDAEIEQQVANQPPPTNPSPPPQQQQYREEHRQVSGTITLTINGTMYTDHVGGELGKPCSTESNPCTPPAYMCVLVTSTSGLCAPH